jgi:hypothetical protein
MGTKRERGAWYDTQHGENFNSFFEDWLLLLAWEWWALPQAPVLLSL